MTAPDPPASPPGTIPAATLVVFRRGTVGGAPELLMLQRATAMRYAGGMTVFPGGRIDPADHVLAARLAANGDIPDAGNDLGHDPIPAIAARIAAIRETLEETGLLVGVAGRVTAEQAQAARAQIAAHGALAPVLDHFGWRLALDALIPFARWCPDFARAFDTHFFLADIGSGQVDLAIDQTETTHLFWSDAAGTLAMAGRGEIGLIFPTRRNLERLARFASFEEAAAECRAIPPRLIVPWKERRDGRDHLCIPEGYGYPVTGEPLDTVMRG